MVQTLRQFLQGSASFPSQHQDQNGSNQAQNSYGVEGVVDPVAVGVHGDSFGVADETNAVVSFIKNDSFPVKKDISQNDKIQGQIANFIDPQHTISSVVRPRDIGLGSDVENQIIAHNGEVGILNLMRTFADPSIGSLNRHKIY